MGRISSLAEGRYLVRESFPPTTFEPHDSAAWDDAYERFLRLLPE
jgi:rhamnulokinase